MSSTIYLDHNATTPPCPEVLAAMAAAATAAWANPASVHGPGRAARARLDDAREAIGALVGLHPRDVTLTSGGTEANNLALAHAFPEAMSGVAAAGSLGSLVVTRIEHPSVTRAAERLAERGVAVEWVDPEPSGRVAPGAVREAMELARRRGELRLVAVQAVNHETGVIQPVAEIAALARAAGVPLHVDAVQAAGRLERPAWEGADLVAIASHKIRGPKGIGALATRPGIRLRALFHGGAQERGIRPGTQDPVAAAGFAAAAARALSGPARYAELAPLRDRLEAELTRLGDRHGVRPLRNGDAPRAPHVSNLSWPGWRGDELAAALDLEGVAVSSGSACSAGTAEPSPVLRAMLGEERARGAVRVSLGEDTSLEVIPEAVSIWDRVLSRRGTRSSRSA